MRSKLPINLYSMMRFSRSKIDPFPGKVADTGSKNRRFPDKGPYTGSKNCHFPGIRAFTGSNTFT
jgi:hypothetical protein